MSLVGTRPPTVDEYEQYEIGHRKRSGIQQKAGEAKRKYMRKVMRNLYIQIRPRYRRAVR